MRWSSVSESERTFDGPIFPITREDTDFGLPFGHVVRASSRGGGILFTLHNTFEWSLAFGEERPSSPTSGPCPVWLSALLVQLLAATNRLCGQAGLLKSLRIMES